MIVVKIEDKWVLVDELPMLPFDDEDLWLASLINKVKIPTDNNPEWERWNNQVIPESAYFVNKEGVAVLKDVTYQEEKGAGPSVEVYLDEGLITTNDPNAYWARVSNTKLNISKDFHAKNKDEAMAQVYSFCGDNGYTLKQGGAILYTPFIPKSVASGTSDVDNGLSGYGLIKQERQRQKEVKGWTAEHDAQHTKGELKAAALCYWGYNSMWKDEDIADMWPWEKSWWKPSKDKKKDLIRAGALYMAENDRAGNNECDIQINMLARKIDVYLRNEKAKSWMDEAPMMQVNDMPQWTHNTKLGEYPMRIPTKAEREEALEMVRAPATAPGDKFSMDKALPHAVMLNEVAKDLFNTPATNFKPGASDSAFELTDNHSIRFNENGTLFSVKGDKASIDYFWKELFELGELRRAPGEKEKIERREAISFIKWIKDENIEEGKGDYWIDVSEKVYTSEELYNLFLAKKNRGAGRFLN